MKHRLPRKTKKLYIRSGLTSYDCKWLANNQFAGMNVIEMVNKYLYEQSE